jgi:pimeloyl-ACP methyl ester carboxylesterase
LARAGALLFLALGLASCQPASVVEPTEVRSDTQISLTLAPNAPITAWRRAGQRYWRSLEPAWPEADGDLVLTGDTPVMRLSAPAPDGAAPRAVREAFANSPPSAIVLEQGGAVVARLDLAPPIGVSAQDITLSNGWTGVLARPRQAPQGGAPTLLVIHGSSWGPGLNDWAQHMAAHGLMVLSLRYLGGDASPCLQDIALDFFREAASRLADAPGAAGPPVVLGISRGAEAAILLADAEPAAVAGVITVSGFSHVLAGARSAQCPADTAPWRLGGEPVGHLPLAAASARARALYRAELERARAAPADPFTEVAFRDAWVADAPNGLRDRARLPTYQLRQPLLAIAGDEDGLWSAAEAARATAAARADHCVLILAGAGHDLLSMPWAAITPPEFERDGVRRTRGGAARAALMATSEINARIADFVRSRSCE